MVDKLIHKIRRPHLPHCVVKGVRDHQFDAQFPQQRRALVGCGQVIAPCRPPQHHVRMREKCQHSGDAVLLVRGLNQPPQQKLVSPVNTIKHPHRDNGGGSGLGLSQLVDVLHSSPSNRTDSTGIERMRNASPEGIIAV